MSQRQMPTMDILSAELAALEKMALEGLTQNDAKERLAFIAERLLYIQSDVAEIAKNLTALCGVVFVEGDENGAELPPVAEVH